VCFVQIAWSLHAADRAASISPVRFEHHGAGAFHGWLPSSCRHGQGIQCWLERSYVDNASRGPGALGCFIPTRGPSLSTPSRLPFADIPARTPPFQTRVHRAISVILALPTPDVRRDRCRDCGGNGECAATYASPSRTGRGGMCVAFLIEYGRLLTEQSRTDQALR
jgi:hypothetical protein